MSETTTRFRVIDTALRDGRRNVAFDQAMIEAHKQGEISNSIRFIQFPPTVLIGRHQVLNHEIEVDYCRENNIGIARRITGGGAIYFDEGQLGWSLVFKRSDLAVHSLEDITKAICEAAASGLRELGVNAQYRPRNDIEVDGRKISGTGGFFDGDTMFYQGTVLIDMDPSVMVAALRIPAQKLAKKDLSCGLQRVTTLKALLGTAPALDQVKRALLDGFSKRLGISTYIDSPHPVEETLAREIYDDEVGNDDFVAEINAPTDASETYVGTHASDGGTITSFLRLDGPRQDRIREVLLTGDFFVAPPRQVFDLEASLRGVKVEEVRSHIDNFFATSRAGLLSVQAQDFAAAINNARTSAKEAPSKQ